MAPAAWSRLLDEAQSGVTSPTLIPKVGMQVTAKGVFAKGLEDGKTYTLSAAEPFDGEPTFVFTDKSKIRGSNLNQRPHRAMQSDISRWLQQGQSGDNNGLVVVDPFIKPVNEAVGTAANVHIVPEAKIDHPSDVRAYAKQKGYTQFVGGVQWNKGTPAAILYAIDDYDASQIEDAGVTMRPGELLVRYVTHNGMAAGMMSIMKINWKTGNVYPLRQEAADAGRYEFESRRIKAQYLTLSQEFMANKLNEEDGLRSDYQVGQDENWQESPAAEYDRNEDENNHSANILLLAKTVGTPRDVQQATAALRYRDSRKGFSTGDALANQHRANQQRIHTELWSKFHAKFGGSTQTESGEWWDDGGSAQYDRSLETADDHVTPPNPNGMCPRHKDVRMTRGLCLKCDAEWELRQDRQDQDQERGHDMNEAPAPAVIARDKAFADRDRVNISLLTKAIDDTVRELKADGTVSVSYTTMKQATRRPAGFKGPQGTNAQWVYDQMFGQALRASSLGKSFVINLPNNLKEAAFKRFKCQKCGNSQTFPMTAKREDMYCRKCDSTPAVTSTTQSGMPTTDQNMATQVKESLKRLRELQLRLTEAVVAPDDAEGEDPTVADTLVPLRFQAATIIAKTLGGARISGAVQDFRSGGGTPAQLVDFAVRMFIRNAHSPEGWAMAGSMLRQAHLMEIPWNIKLLSSEQRKLMGLVKPAKADSVAPTKIQEDTMLNTILSAARSATKAYMAEAPIPPVETLKAWDLSDVKTQADKFVGKLEKQLHYKHIYPGAFVQGVRRGEDGQVITQDSVDAANFYPDLNRRLAFAAGIASTHTEALMIKAAVTEGRGQIKEDGRRCPRHPEVTIPSNGMFDGLCPKCEKESDDEYANEVGAEAEAQNEEWPNYDGPHPAEKAMRNAVIPCARCGYNLKNAGSGDIEWYKDDIAPRVGGIKPQLAACAGRLKSACLSKAKSAPVKTEAFGDDPFDGDLLDRVPAADSVFGQPRQASPAPAAPGGLTPEALRKMEWYQLITLIKKDWKPTIHAYAKPYFEAMQSMNGPHDQYGYDSGAEIVLRFLGNATSWKGPVARLVKAELKDRLKRR